MLRLPSWRITGTFAIGACLLAGCPRTSQLGDAGVDTAGQTADADTSVKRTKVVDLPLTLNRNLDLLFVVDNSGSMKEEQAGLAANFPKFTQILSQIEGGLPDIHIGVVSSNLGAGNNGINGCAAPGDAGHLLQGPPGTTCAGLDAGATFVSDVANPAGGRARNYSGDLDTMFSCMAALGTTGCGLESHLESMRQALDPNNTFNAGFLRPNAFLGIVIIGDEDDCSAKDASVFAPADMTKGPINFRCTAYGVTCDGDADPLHMLVKGARTNCKPREDSQFIYPVQRYIDFVKALKADPHSIIVADIGGPATPFVIGDNTYEQKPTEPALQASCQASNGYALPDVRRAAFVNAFPDRNATASICNNDLSDSLILVADAIRHAIGNPCVENVLADRDPATAGVQPDCVVSEVVDEGTSHEVVTSLPACLPAGGNSGPHTNTPCWSLALDDQQCAAEPQHLKLVIDHGDAIPPTSAHARMSCVVEQ